MKKCGTQFWILLSAFLLAAGSVVAGPPQAVTECGTIITEPGKYRLVNDLPGCTAGQHGVVIRSSDVTLDLRGHTISCDGSLYSAGVVIGWFLPETLENVRVRNGTIVNCIDGILLSDAIGTWITRMNFMYNWEGGVVIYTPFGEGTFDSLIKHNHFEWNGAAILAWDGVGNTYSHNTMVYVDNGIDLQQESNSLVKCNTIADGGFGISIGPYSSGNEVRGNVVTGNWSGIFLYGLNGTDEFGDPFLQPVPGGNLVRNNIAMDNGIPGWPASDLNEGMYDLDWDWPYVFSDATCQNTWFNNQFSTQLGPDNCIGQPVVLEEEDVCALDYDD